MDKEALPEPLRAEFDAIRAACSQKDAKGDEGRHRATLSELNDQQAEALADRILDLYFELEDYRVR